MIKFPGREKLLGQMWKGKAGKQPQRLDQVIQVTSWKTEASFTEMEQTGRETHPKQMSSISGMLISLRW